MDDMYAIDVAKTEFREAFNHGDPSRILEIADPGLVNFSDRQPSEFGESGSASLKRRLEKLFADYNAKLSVIAIEIRIQSNVPRLRMARPDTEREVRERVDSLSISLCSYLEKKHSRRVEALDVYRQLRCGGSFRARGSSASEAKPYRVKIFL